MHMIPVFTIMLYTLATILVFLAIGMSDCDKPPAFLLEIQKITCLIFIIITISFVVYLMTW